MPSPWVWVAKAHTYRNTVTGRFMGATEMLGLRDTFAAAQAARAADLAERLAGGDIGLEAWQKAMRNDLKTSYIDQYVLAVGGRKNMTPSDWGRIGRMLRDQYGYLENFSRDIASGNMTAAQIAARAQMYHGSSVQAFERGNAASLGVPRLPAYPGDGSTSCMTNCRCHWHIVKTEPAWECTWVLDQAAEHCVECVERATNWAPLVVTP